MIFVNITYLGTETEGSEFSRGLFDVGPVMDQTRLDSYPQVNRLVPSIIGMRSIVKGAAFTMPIGAELLIAVKEIYEKFVDSYDDASSLIVA